MPQLLKLLRNSYSISSLCVFAPSHSTHSVSHSLVIQINLVSLPVRKKPSSKKQWKKGVIGLESRNKEGVYDLLHYIYINICLLYHRRIKMLGSKGFYKHKMNNARQLSGKESELSAVSTCTVCNITYYIEGVCPLLYKGYSVWPLDSLSTLPWSLRSSSFWVESNRRH